MLLLVSLELLFSCDRSNLALNELAACGIVFFVAVADFSSPFVLLKADAPCLIFDALATIFSSDEPWKPPISALRAVVLVTTPDECLPYERDEATFYCLNLEFLVSSELLPSVACPANALD